jgi:hypothetical protein
MIIPVVKETFHTRYVVFVCNNVFGITICCTRTWHIVYDRFLLLLLLSCRLTPLDIWYIPNTYCLQQKWKANKYSPIPQFLLNHLGFKYVRFERTWWILFQKQHYTSCMKYFFYYWYCHVCLTPLGIWYHHLLDMNTTYRVWYIYLPKHNYHNHHDERI